LASGLFESEYSDDFVLWRNKLAPGASAILRDRRKKLLKRVNYLFKKLSESIYGFNDKKKAESESESESEDDKEEEDETYVPQPTRSGRKAKLPKGMYIYICICIYN
jgi:hypothetical protein